MRNKTKSKKLFPPHPSLLPGLNSIPDFLYILPPSATGRQGMGAAVSSSYVVSAAPSSSRPSPAPVWGSSYGRQFSVNCSHGLQFFTNCPGVGPSHRVPSFRNRLLQRGSPTGPQALPANLLQRGLVSPWGHKSWQEPAPARAPHGVTASFGHPPALAWGPPWAAGGDLLHHGPPRAAGDSLPHHGLRHGLQGTACLTMVCSTGCRGTSGAWSISSLPAALTLGSAELFVMYSHSFLQLQMSLLQVFFPC